MEWICLQLHVLTCTTLDLSPVTLLTGDSKPFIHAILALKLDLVPVVVTFLLNVDNASVLDDRFVTQYRWNKFNEILKILPHYTTSRCYCQIQIVYTEYI